MLAIKAVFHGPSDSDIAGISGCLTQWRCEHKAVRFYFIVFQDRTMRQNHDRNLHCERYPLVLHPLLRLAPVVVLPVCPVAERGPRAAITRGGLTVGLPVSGGYLWPCDVGSPLGEQPCGAMPCDAPSTTHAAGPCGGAFCTEPDPMTAVPGFYHLSQALVRRFGTPLDVKVMSMLPIEACRVDDDGDARIRLATGQTFCSRRSNDSERRLYRRHRAKLPGGLTEDAMGAALNICARYVRENCNWPQPPRSHHLQPGWGYVDLGAFIGFGAIKAAEKVGPAGRVLAVEAREQNMPLLKRNIQANRLVHCTAVHAAICDADQPVELYVGDRQSNSLLPQLDNQLRGGSIRYSDRQVVPGRTVDSLLREHGWPLERMGVLVNFEINGGELDALRGMDMFFERCRRFDLRITTVYGSPGTAPLAAQVIEHLRSVGNVHIATVPGCVYGVRR